MRFRADVRAGEAQARRGRAYLHVPGVDDVLSRHLERAARPWQRGEHDLQDSATSIHGKKLWPQR